MSTEIVNDFEHSDYEKLVVSVELSPTQKESKESRWYKKMQNFINIFDTSWMFKNLNQKFNQK